MADESSVEARGTEVRTYFVRGRNALLARADFSEMFVDYYLNAMDQKIQRDTVPDTLLKDALAAITLHCASRPWGETVAWTVHFAAPPVNVFVTGDSRGGCVTGNAFTEGVKDIPEGRFYSDTIRDRTPPRRSVTPFEGPDFFGAVEAYYRRSEQRPARYFRYAEEDVVMLCAQPDCDMAWFDSLDDAAIRALDQNEELGLLETRHYRLHCGCDQSRIIQMIAGSARGGLDELFGGDESLRVQCPRCGTRHNVTREAVEAHLARPAGKKAG